MAAKASILAALKVIHEKQQGSLEEKIVRRNKKGLVRVKTVSEDKLKKRTPG